MKQVPRSHLVHQICGVGQQENGLLVQASEQRLVAAGVARGRDRGDATVTEEVVVAVELMPVEIHREISLDVDQPLVDGRVAGKRQLLALDKDRRMSQPSQASGVIEVQV